MSGWFEKFKNAMLGIEYEADDADGMSSDVSGYAETRETESPVRNYQRSARHDQENLEYVNVPKSKSNIINFQSGQSVETTQWQVVLTTPSDVQDATLVCKQVKEGKACVVNLEGVERAMAQRIADFLGGVSFALSGEIERISSNIFIIAPPTVHITADLKEVLRSGRFSFESAAQ